MMQLHVRFFASIREKLHRAEATWSAPAGATVREVLDHLCREFPPLVALRPSVSVAVNREYVDPDHVLTDGDEIALIPPVSGGCDV
ncbi:MAG: molybdopterin converting factor subunit 1 [Deltaproteobacteria bacterium]|nr:molybdopterin converting factor subunit 1 [Deltaproteobacteria bacterium]MBI3390473.1 molybdopterin converting factor subunit 1 [Deltaproteobacteria bacterium]